jgi:hypothetical protein|tara:strand:- start:564 stop:1340 length:777 start_codon:yes stop_codon:yes gene_type:complete
MEKLIIKLKNLKKFNIVGVKQSLEDEGASFDDIKIMRTITKKAKVKLNVKIGGCEAKNDIFFCKKISTDSIVAPMVESEYALKKFIQCAGSKKKNLLFINLETNLSLINLPKMIKSKSFKYLDGVVIGRSDLAGSLNLTKEDVNKNLIFKKVQRTFKRIKSIVRKKMIFKMGGSITPSSKIFIRTLYKKNLLQNIETRNVEIKLSNFVIENLDKIIPLIFDFELSWLKFKLNKKNIKKNKLISLDYKKRIREIEKRLS